jgi:ubiquinone biosynthesis protein UbiJ
MGRVAALDCPPFDLQLTVTPAGLLDLALPGAAADLSLFVQHASMFDALSKMAAGDKPDLRIEGDVHLAADVNWLVDNLRWDMEEDLAKIFGDVAAHRMVQLASTLVTPLRLWVGRNVATKP